MGTTAKEASPPPDADDKAEGLLLLRETEREVDFEEGSRVDVLKAGAALLLRTNWLSVFQEDWTVTGQAEGSSLCSKHPSGPTSHSSYRSTRSILSSP